MACLARLELTRTLAAVLNNASGQLPVELRERARRVLDLHGSPEALEGPCKASQA